MLDVISSEKEAPTRSKEVVEDCKHAFVLQKQYHGVLKGTPPWSLAIFSCIHCKQRDERITEVPLCPVHHTEMAKGTDAVSKKLAHGRYAEIQRERHSYFLVEVAAWKCGEPNCKERILVPLWNQ